MALEKEKLRVFEIFIKEGFTGEQIGGLGAQVAVKELKIPEWVKDQTFESWKTDYEAYRKQTLGEDDESVVGKQKKEKVRIKLLEMLKKIEDEKIKEFVKTSIVNNDSVKTTIEGILAKLEDRFGVSQEAKDEEAINGLYDHKYTGDVSDILDSLEKTRRDVEKSLITGTEQVYTVRFLEKNGIIQ